MLYEHFKGVQLTQAIIYIGSKWRHDYHRPFIIVLSDGQQNKVNNLTPQGNSLVDDLGYWFRSSKHGINLRR